MVPFLFARQKSPSAVSCILCVTLGVFLMSITAGCSQPAALDSPEAHASADALYTAITSRRPDLMSDVEARLKSLKESGKLSPSAHEELTAIITTARQEQWQPAAEKLDAFIRHQPAHDHAH